MKLSWEMLISKPKQIQMNIYDYMVMKPRTTSYLWKRYKWALIVFAIWVFSIGFDIGFRWLR